MDITATEIEERYKQLKPLETIPDEDLEKMLDNLLWAVNFCEKYERKHKK